MFLADGAFSGVSPNERDNPPTDWARTKLTPDIKWKYHHIIPWTILRDTWQGLLMCMWWKEICFYVKAIDASLSLVERLKDKRMTFEDRLELFAKLSWPAWNIVEGPADRDDEGGTELDSFDHGLTAVDQSRMTAISMLYQAMSTFLVHFDRIKMMEMRELNREKTVSEYNPQGGAPNGVETSREALNQALRRITNYSKSSFIPYSENMWMMTLQGRVHQKHPSLWTRTPRFKKWTGNPKRPAPLSIPQIGLTKCDKCYHKFDASKALSGKGVGLKICPRCSHNVYTPKNIFQDTGFTVCENCGTHYETPFGLAPCPKCYLMNY